MTGRDLRKKRRQLGIFVVPSLLIALSFVVIVVNGYWSRSSRDEKYALPADRSAPSMLKFLRRLDGEYVKSTPFSGTNLEAINESIRGATKVLDQDSTGLSQAEIREAQYYRLHWGYLALMTTELCKDEGEWKDLLMRTQRFVNETTKLARKEPDLLRRAMIACDTFQRYSEAIDLANLIEEKFKSLPDQDGKSEVIQHFVGIRDRIQLVGKEIELATNSLDGKPIQLTQFRGKVVLLDFYTTTCAPCIADLPALKRIYSSYHDKGFEILSICLDVQASKMDSFVKEHQLPWIHICHDPVEGNEELRSRFSINSFPTTMLLDQSGKLIKHQVRPLVPPGKEDMNLEENLKKLL